MGVYLIINIFIIILAIVCFGSEKGRCNLDICILDRQINYKIFIFTTFIILFIVSAFRGDFTSDYRSYSEYFGYINNFSLKEIMNMQFYQEKGYVLLNKLIGFFTNKEIYLMITTTFIILILFYSEFIRKSKYVWFSILLFVNVGAYYTSFNITRQILSAAIIFSGSKFLYERKFIKYTCIVVLASFFHRTALIMIPFYFILNYKFKMKNIIFIFLGSMIVSVNLEKIIMLIQRYYYMGYDYGMGRGSVNGVIVPIAILIFVLTHSYIIDFKEKLNTIILNGTIFYTLFSILGLKVQMIQRLAEFFSPYMLIMIPNIIFYIKDKKLRCLYSFIIIVFLILYNYITLSGTGYDPYYFINI